VTEPRPILRRASPDDSRACYDLFLASASDLSSRLGAPWEPDPEALWPRLLPMYEMLAAHCAEWWVAERPDDGLLLGYARSIERGALFELSEFFVRPGSQSGGIGKRLLERAFPLGRGEVRTIIATIDVRAQARYYRAGTAARFPILSLFGPPREAGDEELRDLEATPVTEVELPEVTALERAVLEFPRPVNELRWLLSVREGWLYRRDGRAIGFGFVGNAGTGGSGPVATLEPADQVPILRHLEGRAAVLGRESLAWEIPSVNEVAMRHLLDRNLEIDPFITLLMASRPFGQFDRFIGMAPPFVL
jgi:GNAT superfamily N-acetyltransferase